MSAVTTINKAIQSGVLIEGLTIIPAVGANDQDIEKEENTLPRHLSDAHKSLLKKWNGANLDIIRLHGCGNTHEEINKLSDSQSDLIKPFDTAIIFGDDPSGFIYAEKENGTIISILSSTGEVKEIAHNIDDLFDRLIFGADAKEFGGEEWAEELANAGLA